jgi:hypothetical protein
LNFGTCSQLICSSNHLSPFTKLVEGCMVYNFAICIWVHLIQGFWRKTRSKPLLHSPSINRRHVVLPREPGPPSAMVATTASS